MRLAVVGVLLSGLAVWCTLPGLAAAVQTPVVDYARDVQPILTDNCVTCHGPDAILRERGLRLDVRDGLFEDRGRFGGPVVVAGDLEGSELYRRVTAEDERRRMPKAGSGFTLTPEQIDTVRRWIQAGAP